MAIGKPILEGSSQAQKRSRTQILTPSDPKISGKEPKTLSKRAHNPPPKQAGLTSRQPPTPPGGPVNTVRPQSCSMLIIYEKPDSLLEGRCFQSRSRCRNVRPASIGLPGSAQQRTPRTE